MNSLKSKETKNRTIKARMSDAEYDAFVKKRSASGLSESELIRRAVLEAEIHSSHADRQQAAIHICNIQTMLNQIKLRQDDPMLDAIQGEVSDLCRCLL
jgi:hypothetical protein